MDKLKRTKAVLKNDAKAVAKIEKAERTLRNVENASKEDIDECVSVLSVILFGKKASAENDIESKLRILKRAMDGEKVLFKDWIVLFDLPEPEDGEIIDYW